MSVVSFDTSSLLPGIEITRATVVLTRGRMKGNPLGSLGNLLMDVQTGGFGSSTALAMHDFEAAASAPAAGQLFVDSSSAVGDLDATGIAAINPAGVTQVRLRFEIDDDDDAVVDFLGFYASDNATSSRHPMLEIEYEYWAP